VIVVDDVLNTGLTLGFAILPYWRLQPAKLQIAVLVDRNHRNFPLSPDSPE
jgi:pyrimidine operon attenuation protein/uracil phosphoribosyltransferase